MRYDITVITKDKASLAKAGELISGHSTIVSQRELPDRPFKYRIGQLSAGSYGTFVVEIDRATMVGLHRAMNLDEEITRSLVSRHQEVKQLGRDEPQEELSVPEPVAQAPKAIELKPEEPAKTVVAKKPEPKKVVKTPKKITEVSEKERLKLLDEQLRKLLQE